MFMRARFVPGGGASSSVSSSGARKTTTTAAAMPNSVKAVGSPSRIICAPTAQPAYCVME